VTPSLTIRPARLSDAPALEALFEVLDEHHRHARPHVFRRPPAARREQIWLEETIQGPDSAILVVEGADQKIIALAVLRVKSVAAIPIRAARQFVEIIELVVAAEARHLGAGRRLIDAAKAWARDRDIPALEVSAWTFNRDAIDFYKNIGFEPTVERFVLALPQIQGKYRENIET
jgi:GNAT superfamily N-acetyltransferase